jgi:hypothetical protein
MANIKGTGLMMVWVDVPADKEAEFNKWYNEEHLAELMSVPGILNAARYEAVSSGPKHLACYEIESTAVFDTEAFKNRPVTEWAKRAGVGAVATTRIGNRYEMIYPEGLTSDIAQSGMAPALQIGRMDIGPADEDEWNQWYSGVYVPNYMKVPGCIRGRRWKSVLGEPKYLTVYEFEHEDVSKSPEWLTQREAHPDNPRMQKAMSHASGSPGIWKKTFQL